MFKIIFTLLNNSSISYYWHYKNLVLVTACISEKSFSEISTKSLGMECLATNILITNFFFKFKLGL